MKKYKINIDSPSLKTDNSPPISFEEIESTNNFDSILKDYKTISMSKKMDWEIKSGKLVKKGFVSANKWIVSSVAIIAITAAIYFNYEKEEPKKEISQNEWNRVSGEKSAIKKDPSKDQKPGKTELKKNDVDAEDTYSENKLTISGPPIPESKNSDIIEKPIASQANPKSKEVLFPKNEHSVQAIDKKHSENTNKISKDESSSSTINRTNESSVQLKEKNIENPESKSLNNKSSKSRKRLNLDGLNFGKGIKKKGNSKEVEPKEVKAEEKEKTKTVAEEVVAAKTNLELEKLSQEIAQLQKEIEEKEKNNFLKPQRANPARHQFNLGILSKQFPELAKLKGVLFEVGEENEHFMEEHKEIEWTNGEIKEGTKRGNYQLTLTAGKTSNTFLVYPVYMGKDFDNALKEFNSYQNSLIELKQELRDKDAKLKMLQAAK